MKRMKFRVRDIRSNPFRDLIRYPLRPEKVEALRESFREAGGFWENIVARIGEDGMPELAYGHHRLEALRLEYGPEHEVVLNVREIDDGTMLQMMIRENLITSTRSAIVEQESVRAIISAYAAGKIELPKPGGGDSQHRFAPSFRVDETSGVDRTSPYSAGTLAEYLGWNRSRVDNTLHALELIEEEILTEGEYHDLKPTHALVMTRTISKVVATWRGQVADYEQDAASARKEYDNAESEEMRDRAERCRAEALGRAKFLRREEAQHARYYARVISRNLREGIWSAAQVSGKVGKRFKLDKVRPPSSGERRSRKIAVDEFESPAEVEFYHDSLDTFSTQVLLVLEVPAKSFSLEAMCSVVRQHGRLREALLKVEREFKRRGLRMRARGQGGIFEFIR